MFGPFFVEGAPQLRRSARTSPTARAGEPCEVRGTVRGLDGEPVAGAEIEVWQADAEGKYDVQREGLAHAQARGVLHADARGPATTSAPSWPRPTRSPTTARSGDMLRATRRHPWRPAHLHFMIKAPGYETLITHVFRDGDQYLDSDAVFGVRQSLIADWEQAGRRPLPGRLRLRPQPAAEQP